MRKNIKMAKFRSKETIHARKITKIMFNDPYSQMIGSALILVEPNKTVCASEKWMRRYNPKVGGYYVEANDQNIHGSYRSAEEIEKNYEQLTSDEPLLSGEALEEHMRKLEARDNEIRKDKRVIQISVQDGDKIFSQCTTMGEFTIGVNLMGLAYYENFIGYIIDQLNKKTIRLKEDLIIPKGTIFEDISNMSVEYGDGNFETNYGIGNDLSMSIKITDEFLTSAPEIFEETNKIPESKYETYQSDTYYPVDKKLQYKDKSIKVINKAGCDLCIFSNGNSGVCLEDNRVCGSMARKTGDSVQFMAIS